MDSPSLYEKVDRLLHGGDYNPDQWLPWPEIIDEDFRLMPLAGCNAFSVNIFGWAACEPREGEFDFGWLDMIMDRLAENGHYAILATPSGSKPAWMSNAHPEIRRVNVDGMRERHGRRHNHCYSSPVYRDKVRIMNTKLAERYKNHPALVLWHVSNEYSGSCWCGLCRDNFRAWLRDKYGTIDALNTAWWTRFWSHQYNGFGEIDVAADRTVEGMMLDWRRFTTHMTVDFYRAECEPLRRITPDVPVTVNFMGLFNGLDYNRFAPHIDIATNDSYPGLRDDSSLITRAQRNAFACDWLRTVKKGRPWLLMESCPSSTNWQAVSKLKAPGIHMLEMLSNVAHGADGTLYFQWRKSRGGSEKFHGAVVDHEGSENTRVFREVAAVGERLAKLAPVRGSVTRARAALVFDWDARWALELSWGPNNDDDPEKGYYGTLQDWHRAFWDANIPVDVVESTADLTGYALVAAPMLFLLKDGVAAAFRRFVENGGILLGTYLTGVMDARDLCLPGGWPGDGLRELFGVWAEEIDTPGTEDSQSLVRSDGAPAWLQGPYPVGSYCDLLHAEGAEVLGACGGDFYAGRPLLTRNGVGKGAAWYLGGRGSADLRTHVVKGLAGEAGLAPCLGADLPAPVRVRHRANDTETFIFVQNYSNTPQAVDFGRECRCLESGDTLSECELPPFGVRVLVTDNG